MKAQRDADRHVVCGPCQMRYLASHRRCPSCHSDGATVEHAGINHMTSDVSPVTIVSRPDGSGGEGVER